MDGALLSPRVHEGVHKLEKGQLKDWSERRDLNSGPLAPHGIYGCNRVQRFATR